MKGLAIVLSKEQMEQSQLKEGDVLLVASIVDDTRTLTTGINKGDKYKTSFKVITMYHIEDVAKQFMEAGEDNGSG